MNEKFTPGPWNTEYSYRKDWYEIYGDEGMIMIAAAFNCQHKLDRANAALIAATPELYEDLKRLVRRVEGHEMRKIFNMTDGLMDKIDADLKKARGT